MCCVLCALKKIMCAMLVGALGGLSRNTDPRGVFACTLDAYCRPTPPRRHTHTMSFAPRTQYSSTQHTVFARSVSIAAVVVAAQRACA